MSFWQQFTVQDSGYWVLMAWSWLAAYEVSRPKKAPR